MRAIVLSVLLSMMTSSYAQQDKSHRFVDFDFNVNSYSLKSPEIKLNGYLTPNRNLLKVHVFIDLYGISTTTKPTNPVPIQTYNNLLMGETKKYTMPILIDDPKNNNISIEVVSVDTRNNREKESFVFSVSMPQNSVIKIRKE